MSTHLTSNCPSQANYLTSTHIITSLPTSLQPALRHSTCLAPTLLAEHQPALSQPTASRFLHMLHQPALQHEQLAILPQIAQLHCYTPHNLPCQTNSHLSLTHSTTCLPASP
ncbi:unnamed protein product [Rangifer tarandus platyrhynchus]|uniref:Uncharacterized protein n=1 Tax=Rangifer tarandus platyrhynchus TaxID=3082113 RepID=A0AC59Y191_RANTA